MLLQEIGICLLVAILRAVFFGIEGKGRRSYLSRHSYLSYPGLTEDSTMHAFMASVFVDFIVASVAK